MSAIAALLILSQSAAPTVAEAALEPRVAAQVTASARVLRPARISFETVTESQGSRPTQDRSVQRTHDALGTVWIEFS